jgi:hypothetical protein
MAYPRTAFCFLAEGSFAALKFVSIISSGSDGFSSSSSWSLLSTASSRFCSSSLDPISVPEE